MTSSGLPFTDRSEAGRALGAALRDALRDRHDGGADDGAVVVLGLPRGGVPVAAEVAAALDAPLDVFVVRKLGTPGHRELAMGAIASGGVRVLNDDVVRQLRIPVEDIERVTAAELGELRRRERAYRGDRPALHLAGATVLLVDDGLATGATVMAAVEAVRAAAPNRVVVAVPVGAPDACRRVSAVADDVVCLHAPERFGAVGTYYRDFGQTPDDEVERLLARERT
jgi:putative phosphoribosyl transferase